MENRPVTYKEDEEFLYDEDFKRVEEELLKGYTKEKDEPYFDGIDFYPKSMTKRELSTALKQVRNGIVRKNEDCQKGPKL